jgi:hypothetical protein
MFHICQKFRVGFFMTDCSLDPSSVQINHRDVG